MRLIDADALKNTMIETLEAIKANPKMNGQEMHVLAAFKTVGAMIDDAPTVTPEDDWIPFRLREMTEEERKEHRGEKYMWDDNMPEDGQEILVSDREYVWSDTFMDDGDICYLESHDYIYEGMAWMPMPEKYKPKENDE